MLASFLNYDGDALFIPKDLLSDEAIGNFLLELGDIYDYKPHFKKAAIVYLFRVHLKESIFDFSKYSQFAFSNCGFNSLICINVFLLL
jgi:hypothetical protein